MGKESGREKGGNKRSVFVRVSFMGRRRVKPSHLPCTGGFDRRTRLHIDHLQEREQDAKFSKLDRESMLKSAATWAASAKLYNACDSPTMSSKQSRFGGLLFLHHFYLNLITKPYILYAETQSAIPQGLPPGNHPR